MLKKKHLKGNLWNFSFWAVKRSKKVKSTKTADCFTETFPKWPRTLIEEWNWDCFVTSLLSWTLLRFCVSESFVGKVLDLNTNLISLPYFILLSSPAVLFGWHYLLVCSCFCPIAGLQRSIVKSSVPRLSWLQVDKAWKRVLTNSLLQDFVRSCFR